MKKITTILLVCVLAFPSCGRLDTADVNIDEGRKEGRQDVQKWAWTDYNGYSKDECLKYKRYWSLPRFSYYKLMFVKNGKTYVTKNAVGVFYSKRSKHPEYCVTIRNKRAREVFKELTAQFVKKIIKFQDARIFVFDSKGGKTTILTKKTV